jgi:hypothetical protein
LRRGGIGERNDGTIEISGRPVMTLGTIGADDEEMPLGEGDGIGLDAIRGKKDGASNGKVIVVAH